MSQRFFQLNMQFTRAFRKKLNEQLVEVGLYYSQWIIVHYLKQWGSATLVEITNYLDVEKPTISRTVKRLEEQELIERMPSQDKRERKIQLTEKGLEMYEKAYDVVNKFEQSLLEEIPETEMESAFRTIQQLRDKLK
ncbi:MarR family winged helix-turn-helix transcriptional regulator [Oceanobacillus polygoni]|uniref:DNA-binding MarR family transcriptional regulator n=1 Tax=Oceanobacillus polygoni TaxID=1235259 RepID=A0A9X0YTT4_9BACI|nr:MarR family transcriptional regulator [Oceanobacillus polygoni]MBP2078758.1 DNA-binding MarR family transcriptional regulator [Oceanobacillus polygoni]